MGDKHIFMIGIGGAGMAPLAVYLSKAGHKISGYDDYLGSEVRDLLLKQNILICEDGKFPNGVEEIIYSNAISKEHSLRVQGETLGVNQYRRSEYLLKLVGHKKLIAVAGSHGKTTTTAMLIDMLKAAGVDFGYLLGGFFRDKAVAPADYSESDWVVAEIDESDGIIGQYAPEVTIALNLSWDHVAAYPTKESLEATFLNLFKNTQSKIITWNESQVLIDLGQASGTQVVTFDSNCVHNFEKMSAYNLLNASAAWTACNTIFGKVPEFPLVNFEGVTRRQDILYASTNLNILADYAHHPYEISALIKDVQSSCLGQLVVVFQPHRYTRTQQFAKEFADILKDIDRVHLMPVYEASELPVDEGRTEVIVKHLSTVRDDVHISEDVNKLRDLLFNEINKPTTILFVGAGDIDQFALYFSYYVELKTANKLSEDTVFKYNESLANKTTLRVGGSARYYVEPGNEEDLMTFVHFAKQKNLSIFMLGRGSNLIALDEGFDGLVIRLSRPYWKTMSLSGENQVFVRAGVRLKELCGMACREELQGFEFLEGIPGSLGGALRMNAGAMGSCIFDVVDSVRFMTYDGAIVEYSKDQFSVEYRKCSELTEAVALSAVLKSLKKAPALEIAQKLKECAVKRKGSQPRESSAGCIFKNPENSHAGKLIDEAGLKGEIIGGAEISKIHGNFLINKGNATSKDVLDLVRYARDRVQEEYSINLEPEAQLIGKKWEDIL